MPVPFRRPARPGAATLYARAMLLVACFWFAGTYSTARAPYIDLVRYAHGTERMPFQGRDLMRWPLLLAERSATLQRLTAHRAVLHSPDFLTMELLAAVSLLLAGLAAVKVYHLAAPEAPFPELPFAVLVVVCLFDFVLSVPFSFPYDLPATAFIGWGCVFALQRRFWPLLPVFLLGTWNRETTLFVLGVFAVSLATDRDGVLRLRALRARDFAQILTLSAGWVLITGAQKYLYRANPTEAGSRISGNLHHLANPLLWPNILSASAFLLPWVYLKRRQLGFPALSNALVLLPFWVVLLLSVGQVLELRIYGDISVPIAAAAALLLTSGTAGGQQSGGTPVVESV